MSTTNDPTSIGVPEALVDELRIAATVQLTSVCDDFAATLAAFVEPKAWQYLPERLAEVEARVAALRLLGPIKGEQLRGELPRTVVEPLARVASANVLDQIREHIAEESDITKPGVSFDAVTRLAARGRALLALAEEAS